MRGLSAAQRQHDNACDCCPAQDDDQRDAAISDAIAAMSFADKREAARDWRCAYWHTTKLRFRAWLANRVERRLQS